MTADVRVDADLPSCSIAAAASPDTAAVPGLAVASSEQSWSGAGTPAHLLRRGSLDWTALEAVAAAHKSSITSAPAPGGGSDAAANRLEMTESPGVVGHSITQPARYTVAK